MVPIGSDHHSRQMHTVLILWRLGYVIGGSSANTDARRHVGVARRLDHEVDVELGETVPIPRMGPKKST